MKLFKSAKQLSGYLKKLKSEGFSVGYVPTMGALHNGHISLISAARKKNNKVVCSIFVNPTQFNNQSDFQHYPITIEEDLNKLDEAGCDIVFLPSVQEMYPPGYKARKYKLGFLETILEGKYRPGHFQGVCQVVDRFLEIIQPDVLYLGSKDFQQCKVLEKMIELRKYKTQLKFVPTQRDKDGLALSSRNMRLNKTQRKLAPFLYKSLNIIKDKLNVTDFNILKNKELVKLKSKGFQIDYLELADLKTLALLHTKMASPAVLLIAAYVDDIRLIDNIVIR